jgi:tripartite-type tricarboxylate transporter receptor subunit TctC
MRRLLTSAICLAALAMLAPRAAQAQGYPNKPIRIIVPIAPGGVADIATRAFAAKVQETTGHQIVVENRTGAAGIPGADAVAKSPADGYPFLTGYHGVLSILQHMQKLPYDPAKDFVPVVNLVVVPNILVVNPKLPVNNLKELIAYAKANPGKLTYASQGVGTTGHIGGELFKQAAGIDIVHVPYKGAAPAAQDLIAGHVHMLFDVVALARAHINEGRVRAIGIATKERSPALPDIPTLAEQGLPVELTAWFGIVAPTGTPKEAIDWVNQAANKAFASPADRKRFTDTGATVAVGTPDAFGKFIEAETKKFGDVIRKGNITMQ